MIQGEPRVENGLLVDENGDELVIRRKSTKSGDCLYHRVKTEAYDCDKAVEPDCGQITYQEETTWLLRRRVDLEPNWSGCSYEGCYGSYVKGTAENAGPQLSTTLSEMSVEEFDAATSGGDA